MLTALVLGAFLRSWLGLAVRLGLGFALVFALG